MSPVYLKSIAVFFIVLLAAGIGYWFGTHAPPTQAAPDHTEVEPMQSNRLAQETSPYLRLHQHNPVDWYPWGEEAFEKARKEDKPIFLSVGYSSCYWCHVMERLVFSDTEIAKLMNTLFVNIKVDREERPDIDALYMTATQLLSGHGGWPNSVFLTPDLKPFYAGTYFPPEDGHGRPGFSRVLQALHMAWQEKRSDINDQAEQIAQAIRKIHTSQSADTSWSQSDLTDKLQTHFQNQFDWQNGGFGSAPKFPPDQALALLQAPLITIADDAKDMVALTLTKMADGGIQDHLGGGFHRYSTDAKWHVPHFEKMLNNQSLFSESYLRAYQSTQNEIYRQTVEDLLHFVSTTMTDANGGFYSALDAETDAEEGAHYIWTESEIQDILGTESGLFFKAFALAPVPDTQAGALYRTQSDADLAQEKNIPTTEVHTQVTTLKNNLLQERNKRKFPLLDDKIITGWNGLMIAAFAQSARILDRPQDAATAQKAAEFILKNLRDESGTLSPSTEFISK
ncbi:MAG: thioredoxin domain-containing protein [Candidatus Latescibacteria bacterium]|nr:thioredoxin domain-containing protein [Candidatus Latescibacterota bacterium]